METNLEPEGCYFKLDRATVSQQTLSMSYKEISTLFEILYCDKSETASRDTLVEISDTLWTLFETLPQSDLEILTFESEMKANELCFKISIAEQFELQSTEYPIMDKIKIVEV